MDLKGKVALVTGGAGGIGRACCEELLKHGCKVAICDINSDSGQELARFFASRYGKERILFFPCDVTDYPQFEESFQMTFSRFGNLDIVINNAGVMNDRFWELEVDVNLNGIIRGILLAMKFMGRNQGGRGGVVINTASSRPFVSAPIYTATTHAIVGLTRSYGDQFHTNISGVKVIALCPGLTESSMVNDVRKQLMSSEYEKAWQRDIANSTPQKPEHVAKALIYVLQKSASGSCWTVENSQPPKEQH